MAVNRDNDIITYKYRCEINFVQNGVKKKNKSLPLEWGEGRLWDMIIQITEQWQKKKLDAIYYLRLWSLHEKLSRRATICVLAEWVISTQLWSAQACSMYFKYIFFLNDVLRIVAFVNGLVHNLRAQLTVQPTTTKQIEKWSPLEIRAPLMTQRAMTCEALDVKT